MFRLRTHHAPLNAHLHRTTKEHRAKCVYCPDGDETVDHFLLHCRLNDNKRTRLLPAQPTIHNTLYGYTTQRTATTLPTVQHQNQTTASSTNNTQHAIWIHHTTNSHNIAHCTTSEPDYCQLNQQYTTGYMDPLHNCNEQPTTCKP